MTSKNSKKKPFKQTRELIKLALNDGSTQKDIADKCRTHQSIVSQWKSGSKLAFESQVKCLLDIYGYKLRKKTFKVYWSINSETKETKFSKVEGRVVFSHIIYKNESNNRSCNAKQTKRPYLRFVVHYQGNDCFMLILQRKISNINVDYENATWNSLCFNKLNLNELISYIDNLENKQDQDLRNQVMVMPFMIRSSLLQHGFDVEDVEKFPALW